MTLDKFQQLVSECGWSAAILANGRNGDFQLVDMDAAASIPGDVAQRFRVRGLEFLGIIGLQHGQPRVALESELSDELRAAILAEFLRLYAHAVGLVEGALMGDSAAWLEKLGQLPDTRAN